MTKEEILKEMDIQDGDKIYFVRIRDIGNYQTSCQRFNCGFTAVELLGHLEYTQFDIREQIKGNFKPDIIERKTTIPE